MLSYPPTTNLPDDAMIPINIKNIKLTVKTHDVISTIEFPAASNDFVILESLIGSTNAADNLYINVISISLISGCNRIIIITTNPMELIAFFIISEYPATDVIASENVFPTIGMKLSIANFAVLRVTASMVVDVIPRTVNSPINTVIIIP